MKIVSRISLILISIGLMVSFVSAQDFAITGTARTITGLIPLFGAVATFLISIILLRDEVRNPFSTVETKSRTMGRIGVAFVGSLLIFIVFTLIVDVVLGATV